MDFNFLPHAFGIEIDFGLKSIVVGIYGFRIIYNCINEGRYAEYREKYNSIPDGRQLTAKTSPLEKWESLFKRVEALF